MVSAAAEDIPAAVPGNTNFTKSKKDPETKVIRIKNVTFFEHRSSFRNRKAANRNILARKSLAPKITLPIAFPSGKKSFLTSYHMHFKYCIS